MAMAMVKRWRPGRMAGPGPRLAAAAALFTGCLLSGAMLAGCSSMQLAGSQTSFVLSEDVRGQAQAAELPFIEGEQLAVKEPIPYHSLLAIQDGAAIYNRKGKLRRAPLDGLAEGLGQERTLLPVQGGSVSPDGRQVLYYEQADLYVLDVRSGAAKKLRGDAESFIKPAFNQDGKYVIHQQSGIIINIIEVSSGHSWQLNMEKHFAILNFGTGSIQVWNGELYVDLSGTQTPHGLYRITLDNETAELLLPLPGEQDSLVRFNVLANGKLLFNGIYGGQPGIFVYDPASKRATKLVAGIKNRKDGVLAPSFSLAPDGSKLLFEVLEQETGMDHIFQAELADGRLANSRPILRVAHLAAPIYRLTNWSADSRSYYVNLAQIYEGNEAGDIEFIIRYAF